jgi:hypothetical protein
MVCALDEFFQMYISSPLDTEKREVDDRCVGTILFTPIRPEFRGLVRLSLHRCAVRRLGSLELVLANQASLGSLPRLGPMV